MQSLCFLVADFYFYSQELAYWLVGFILHWQLSFGCKMALPKQGAYLQATGLSAYNTNNKIGKIISFQNISHYHD